MSAAAPSGRRLALACAAWTLAAFSSWHAILCVAGWLVMQMDRGRRRQAAVALAVVAAAAALVVLHLFWAGHWSLLASQSASTRFWFAGSDGSSLGERLGFLWHAFGIALNRYGQLPALLSLAWLVLLAADRARGNGGIEVEERGLIGLGLGSVVYYLLFPRAVSYHAYQGFYLLPFVALTSSKALWRIGLLPLVSARPRLGRWLAVSMTVLTCAIGIASTALMYRNPPARVTEAVQRLERQYR
jgi:hypothetical protein